MVAHCVVLRSPYCKKAKQAMFSVAPMDEVEVIEVRARHCMPHCAHASQGNNFPSDPIL